MRPVSTRAAAAGLALSLLAAALPASGAAAVPPEAGSKRQAGPQEVRFATYNASLNRSRAGDLVADLTTPSDEQAKNIAEVIQRTSPDVLLLNEFDYDDEQRAADLFRSNYLRVSQNGADPINYPYVYVAPSNTGIPSGLDLNNDGTVGGADDALGFGFFEGQYGMVVYSKFPIDEENVRTFQNFLWKDMPGAKLPDDPVTRKSRDWFTREELDSVRLSSKSHWDVPIIVGGETVHVLASHPTPPVFDGAENRNGKRNSDEIRLWADYISGGGDARYIYDDDGGRGGLREGDKFVVMGDQNSDPLDGDSLPGSIDALLKHNAIRDPKPAADGAEEASETQGGANAAHRGDPEQDTADFEDRSAGNLRVDYVLPSKDLLVADAGIFWPEAGTPGSELTGVFPFPTSDHRLVWLDVNVGEK